MSQCMTKSNEIINLEEQCGLQSPLAVYFGSSYDAIANTWFDLSGNCWNVGKGYICNTITTHTNALNGETYISGTTLDKIIFPEDVLPFNWTFFHIAKYNGAVKERIFQGCNLDLDFFSGFHRSVSHGASGIAHHGNWITPIDDVHGSDWVFSTDQRSLYRSNGVD
eukprot:153461_1